MSSMSIKWDVVFIVVIATVLIVLNNFESAQGLIGYIPFFFFSVLTAYWFGKFVGNRGKLAEAKKREQE